MGGIACGGPLSPALSPAGGEGEVVTRRRLPTSTG